MTDSPGHAAKTLSFTVPALFEPSAPLTAILDIFVAVLSIAGLIVAGAALVRHLCALVVEAQCGARGYWLMNAVAQLCLVYAFSRLSTLALDVLVGAGRQADASSDVMLLSKEVVAAVVGALAARFAGRLFQCVDEIAE